jgi:hypothetical protein
MADLPSRFSGRGVQLDPKIGLQNVQRRCDANQMPGLALLFTDLMRDKTQRVAYTA